MFAEQSSVIDATLAMERGWVGEEPKQWQAFFLMPLMHSERMAAQERGVAEFKRLGGNNLKFALLHHDQIKRFGRFPGRNGALGRVSSAEEREVIGKGETFQKLVRPLRTSRERGIDFDRGTELERT